MKPDSFRILLPFFLTSWGVGTLNSAVFNNFHNRVEFGTILEGLRNFGGVRGVEPSPPHPPRYATAGHQIEEDEMDREICVPGNYSKPQNLKRRNFLNDQVWIKG